MAGTDANRKPHNVRFDLTATNDVRRGQILFARTIFAGVRFSAQKKLDRLEDATDLRPDQDQPDTTIRKPLSGWKGVCFQKSGRSDEC
jgi:hypothetical protein